MSGQAREIAAALELRPILAVGLALMTEKEFMAAALAARQLLETSAARAGWFGVGDPELRKGSEAA